MADSARQSPPDLEEGPALSAAYDFFELLRRLERRGGDRFGHSGRVAGDPARIGQQIRLGFAVQDVVAFDEQAENSPTRVTVANLGLMGPEGPMPLHMTRWVLDRLSQRWFGGADSRETSDTTFVDFVNILQHRMISLFYRAWADAHPAVQVERTVGGRVIAMLEAMAGIGLPDMHNGENPDLDVVKLRHAASLASQVDGPERLTQFLAEVFGVRVQLKEFVASWMTVPKPLQTRLGNDDYSALGQSATIGPRTFSRQSRVELRIGPIGLAEYTAFLPGGERLDLLKRAVRDLIGESLDVDVRVILAANEVPAAKIGGLQLGRTAWLPRPAGSEDADDMLMRTVVGWRPDDAKLAA